LRELEYPIFISAYRIRSCLIAYGLARISIFESSAWACPHSLYIIQLTIQGCRKAAQSARVNSATKSPLTTSREQSPNLLQQYLSNPLRSLFLSDWDRSLHCAPVSVLSARIYSCTMNGVRTRKQAVQTVKENGSATANGHASPRGNISRGSEKRENIFLFIPNIIGKEVWWEPRAQPLLTKFDRLLTYLPGHSVPLLHASPSKNMLSTLQCIMSTRCAGRGCSAALSTIYSIRSRTGHGHRPLHHGVLACLLKFCVPKMDPPVPGSDQLGSCESLHAHVCHFEHGRIRPKPQKGRPK